jgi:hypothetical protein
MRLPARFLLTGAAVIAVSSCTSDQVVVPAGSPTINGSSVLRALTVAQTVDFVIPENGADINLLDAFTLKVPAGAVCDPNAADTQTGYANKEWDAPCTPASGDVAVRATLKWQNGVLYADFQPALRFVPNKTVTISTLVLASQVQSQNSVGDREGWTIQYMPEIGAAGISDAESDPSLRTVVAGMSGKIFRRIKHFSGYGLFTSEGWVPCDPNLGNPNCVWIPDE